MKFEFENLGYIDYGEISPGNLTIIAGDNNIGKTYINYVVYGFLYTLLSNRNIEIERSYIDDFLKNGKIKLDLNNFISKIDKILKNISSEYTDEIPIMFSADKSFFSKTKFNFEIQNYKFDISKNIELTIDISTSDKVFFVKETNSTIIDIFFEKNAKDEIPSFIVKDILEKTILEILLQDYIRHPFIITSERTGVSLFYRELDINKNILIERIAKSENIDLPSLFLKNLSRYPISIKHNIDMIRDIYNFHKNDSFILQKSQNDYVKISNKIQKVLNGSFIIKEDQILFEPKKESRRKKVQPIPLHITSSASKSFLLLYLYLKSLAKKNDILIIDEPELNLHPTNQIQMARLLANLVNLGIDVMITTHSDYIIKEFNNLIMLSNDFKEKYRIISDYNYDENDYLKPDKVKTYFVENHQIKDAKVDKFGIDLKLFEDTIYKINQISDDIYYSLKVEE